jgi:hypothetical protein
MPVTEESYFPRVQPAETLHSLVYDPPYVRGILTASYSFCLGMLTSCSGHSSHSEMLLLEDEQHNFFQRHCAKINRVATSQPCWILEYFAHTASKLRCLFARAICPVIFFTSINNTFQSVAAESKILIWNWIPLNYLLKHNFIKVNDFRRNGTGKDISKYSCHPYKN